MLFAGAVSQPSLVVTQRQGSRPSRLVLLAENGTTTVLTKAFAEAADPEVSWDGKRILFAARKTASDHWQIYEMPAEGGAARQVVSVPFDCRNPIYQSTVYVITAALPWPQIAFVANGALYSARLDGSDIRRLTWHTSPDSAPQMLTDGRMVFSSQGGLYAINADGTDFAEFSIHEGSKEKRNPAVTADGQLLFAEPDGLASVSLRRNLHSYRKILAGVGLDSFAALPDGGILLIQKEKLTRLGGGVWPGEGILQARALAPRPEPDGRASVVDETKPTGKLYCLSVHTTDIEDAEWPRLAKRLRVVGPKNEPIGEADLEPDGSFQVEVPANKPMRVQILDARGAVRRQCAEIWVRNNENRGCIGCHEDGELTPENRLANALNKPAVHLGGAK
jgi:hypothetical protein